MKLLLSLYSCIQIAVVVAAAAVDTAVSKHDNN